MEKNYDLTTTNGFQKAVVILRNYGWAISPIHWVFFKIFSPEVSTQKQIEAAKDLIKTGKEQGAKKMKIRVGHKAGVNIGVAYEGIPIKMIAGNHGLVDLEIEY